MNKLHASIFYFLLVCILITGSVVVVFSETNAQLTACHLLDSSKPVPNGYGAAYNVFSVGKELIAETFCDSSTISVVVGKNQTQEIIIVARQGWKWTGSMWEEIFLSGTPYSGDSNWLTGTGRTLISVNDFVGGANSIAVYACLLEGGAWKCGCSNTVCATNNWILQQFNTASVPDPPASACLGAPQGVCDAYENGTATGTYCQEGNRRTVTGNPDYVYWGANDKIYHRLARNTFIEVTVEEWNASQATCEAISSALNTSTTSDTACLGAPQGVCDAYDARTATGTYCDDGVMRTVTGNPDYVYWGANDKIYHRLASNVFSTVPAANWTIYENACKQGTIPNQCTGAPQGVCDAYSSKTATGTYCKNGLISTVEDNPDYVFWGANNTIYHRLYSKVFHTVKESEWTGSEAVCALENTVTGSIQQCIGAPQGVCNAYKNKIATGTYCKDGAMRTVTGDPDYVFWGGNNTIYYRVDVGSFVPIERSVWDAGQAVCTGEKQPPTGSACVGAPAGVCNAYSNKSATGTYCTEGGSSTVMGNPDYAYWGANDTIYYRFEKGVFVPVPVNVWDAAQGVCEAVESRVSSGAGRSCVGAPQEVCDAYNNGTATGTYCTDGIMSTVTNDPDYVYWGVNNTIYYRLARNVFIPIARNEWDAYENACVAEATPARQCVGASTFVCDTYVAGNATGTYCKNGAHSTVTGDPDYVFDGFKNSIHYRLWKGAFGTIPEGTWTAGQNVCSVATTALAPRTACVGAPQGVCNAYKNGTATGTYCKDGAMRTVTGDPDYVFWGGDNTIYYRLEKGAFAKIPRSEWDVFQTQCLSQR